MNLTPTQLIKKAIIKKIPSYFKKFKIPPLNSAEDIESAWDKADEDGFLDDAKNEFREGEVETDGLEVGWSRHCEIKGVAAKIDDFWIGWEYEFGGGRHFCESGNWLYQAYFLDCKEELVTVTKRVFTKKD